MHERGKVVEVTGGRFECRNCGPFVGTYHGDPAEMRCPFCERPLNENDDA